MDRLNLSKSQPVPPQEEEFRPTFLAKFTFQNKVIEAGDPIIIDLEYNDRKLGHLKTKRFLKGGPRKAATVGEYTAQVLLGYPNHAVNPGADHRQVEDPVALLKVAQPKFVHTHNLADKHDNHISTAIKVITAIRSLPEVMRHQKLCGCEVWRDLDWMADSDKVSFDQSAHMNLQAVLLEVFDSQITSGTRYGLANLGRRRANATYYESHEVDVTTGFSYAMNLTPLICSREKEIIPFVLEHIHRFTHDAANRLTRLGCSDL